MSWLDLILMLCFLAGSHTKPAKHPIIRNDIQYGAAEGETLKLDVVMPGIAATGDSSNATSRPAVILVHGGGWQGGDKSGFRGDALWLAKHGFVSIAPNYRLVKEGSGRWPAQLDDVHSAIEWTIQHAAELNIDPGRLGAWGYSAGGQIVAFLSLETTGSVISPDNKPAIKCVVDVCGPSDLTKPIRTPVLEALRPTLIRWLGDVPSPSLPSARSASPVYSVSAKARPILIIHGEKDEIVPVKQARDFFDALQRARAKAKLAILPRENHWFSAHGMDQIHSAALGFFDRHLRR
jgi:acetyl esterase/lipase